MTVRRCCSIFLGIVLLLSGAVSHSSWEPYRSPLPRPEVSLLPRRPWIALTFDDGPHPVMTEKLLSVLKQEGVPGTFFIVGKMAVRNPSIVREIARQGNEVANHTFSHHSIAALDKKALLNELGQTRSLIRKLTGQDCVLYRPPGGGYSKYSLKVASKAGYHMVLWTVLTKDVEGASAGAMHDHILHSASDGGIILMHSGIASTVEMLPQVIEDLRREGYHFVTVSQLVGLDHSHGGFQPVPAPDLPVNPVASR